MNEVIVIGAGPGSWTSLIMGPVSTTGLVEIIQEKDVYGRSNTCDYALVERDKKIAKVRKQMSLAMMSRNKAEVTRLAKQLTYLGQSW